MPDEEETNTVLFSTFVIANKRCRVYFRRNVLIWEMEHLPYKRQTVPVADIIAVNCGTGNSENPSKSRTTGLVGEVNSAFQSGSESLNCTSKFLVIHYAKLADNNKLSVAKVELHHGDPRQVASWFITLENALRRLNRPKNFLIFVNPYCGKRRGNNIFKRSVKPILDLAKVDTKVIVTEHSNHARDVILTSDLSKYDAVLAVGGDGTLSEIINALVLKTIRNANGNENDRNYKIPKVEMPVAIIPGGSTDCIAYCLNGHRDRKTATIYAVLGNVNGMDVCSVHSDDGLQRYFLSVLAYGFLGDVLKESEKHRWMGPRRYEYAGFLKVLKNRRYYCEVTMTLRKRTNVKCFRHCPECEDDGGVAAKPRYQENNLQAIRSKLNLDVGKDGKSKKLTVGGKFFLVSCANISCSCNRSPNGIAPYAHLGDGCMDVLLFRPQSLNDVIKLLIRSGSKSPSETVPDLPFVENYKASEIEFKMIDRKDETESENAVSVWNCDGDVITEPNVHVKNHRRLVKMYSRRPERLSPGPPTSCFGGCHICSRNIVVDTDERDDRK